MSRTTIIFGLLLIALGIGGYFGIDATDPAVADPAIDTPAVDDLAVDENAPADAATAPPAAPKRSVTALIPAFIGAPILLCGIFALRDSWRAAAIHVAVVIATRGLLAGAGRGAMGLGKFFSGDPSLNTRSFVFVWLLAIICGVYVALCVRSFIAARRSRTAAAS